MFKSFNWSPMLGGIVAALLMFILMRFAVPMPMQPAPQQPPATSPAPQQPPAPVPTSDPRDAMGKLIMSGGYCSGTVVNPQQKDGSYTIVSASHCFKSVGEDVSFILRDGRQVKASVVAIDRTPDIAILRTAPVATPLPFLLVAAETPEVGAKVLHAGFGVDVPGNTEVGRVIDRETPAGQVVFSLSVSHGDSGGGICLDAGGRLVSPVCCTTNLNAVGSVFGGKPERIAAMLKTPTAFVDKPPVKMPAPPGD